MASKGKVGYPSDVSDEEWGFVLAYLLLSREDSAHREHDLRAVFNGVPRQNSIRPRKSQVLTVRSRPIHQPAARMESYETKGRRHFGEAQIERACTSD
jgi:hypothetical protein